MMTESINHINPYVVFSGKLIFDYKIPPGTPMNRRKVKWHEIEIILDNDRGYIETGSIDLIPKKGDIITRSPGMIVRGYYGYSSISIVFDLVYNEKKLNSYADKFPFENNVSIERERDYSTYDTTYLGFKTLQEAINPIQMISLFNNFYDEFSSKNAINSLSIKSRLFEILHMIDQNNNHIEKLSHTSASIRNNYPRMENLKKYIHDNIDRKLTLENMAKHIALSPNFLSKIFKNTYDINLFLYINREKIIYSKKLIAETNISISQISEMCGFENDSYFYTVFKKQTGHTPKDYRLSSRP